MLNNSNLHNFLYRCDTMNLPSEVINLQQSGLPLVLEILEILEMSLDFILSWKCPENDPFLAEGPGKILKFSN